MKTKNKKKNSNVYTQKYVNNNNKTHFNIADSLEIKLIDHAKQNHEQ